MLCQGYQAWWTKPRKAGEQSESFRSQVVLNVFLPSSNVTLMVLSAKGSIRGLSLGWTMPSPHVWRPVPDCKGMLLAMARLGVHADEMVESYGGFKPGSYCQGRSSQNSRPSWRADPRMTRPDTGDTGEDDANTFHEGPGPHRGRQVSSRVSLVRYSL